MKFFKELDKFTECVDILVDSNPKWDHVIIDYDESDTKATLDDLISASCSPHEIHELAKIAHDLSLTNIRVIRVDDCNSNCGFCYMYDIFPLLRNTTLITIDDALIPVDSNLQNIFLHELAHTKTVNCEYHDWQFVVALNIMRMECGLTCTVDEYDCCQVNNPHQYSTGEILRMADIIASKLRNDYGYAIGIDCVNLINNSPTDCLHLGYVEENDY